MNDARPAGGFARLEVSIAAKDHAGASGGRQAVLRDVHFTVENGEVGAIFGPSGCGKTTLLRIVAGLDTAFEGTVRRPGDSGNAPGGRSKIGMVFQEPRLLPWRSVIENVRLAAPHADEAALGALFEALGLSAHLGHFPGQLSLGLARRVAIARAFAIEPELLLLDEPFVSLDAALAAKLRSELAALVDRTRVTTLIVTHDLNEAIELADRIFVLSRGPAHVAADFQIDAPRRGRTPESIADIRRAFEARLSAP